MLCVSRVRRLQTVRECCAIFDVCCLAEYSRMRRRRDSAKSMGSALGQMELHLSLCAMGSLGFVRNDRRRGLGTRTFSPSICRGKGRSFSATSSPSPSWPQLPSPCTNRSHGTCVTQV